MKAISSSVKLGNSFIIIFIQSFIIICILPCKANICSFLYIVMQTGDVCKIITNVCSVLIAKCYHFCRMQSYKGGLNIFEMELIYHLLSIQIFYYFWYHLCYETSNYHKLHILYIYKDAYKKSQAKYLALICSLIQTVTESIATGGWEQ